MGVYQLKDTPMQNFWLEVLIAVSLPEWNKKEYSYSKFKKNGWWKIEEGDKVEIPAGVIPGDYGFDPLGLTPKNDRELLQMQQRAQQRPYGHACCYRHHCNGNLHGPKN